MNLNKIFFLSKFLVTYRLRLYILQWFGSYRWYWICVTSFQWQRVFINSLRSLIVLFGVKVTWKGKYSNVGVKVIVFNKKYVIGFSFSSNELTALKQITGGPCAIIATAQAHIICELFFVRKQNLTDMIGEIFYIYYF